MLRLLLLLLLLLVLTPVFQGGKFSNWQGGIHVPAYVSGGALPAARRGVKVDALACLWDLYATFQVHQDNARIPAVNPSSKFLMFILLYATFQAIGGVSNHSQVHKDP